LAKAKAKLYTMLNQKIVKGEIDVEAADVAGLLEKLAVIYGEDFRKEIFDEGLVKNYYIILHNGNVVDRDKPGEAALAEGDVVHIFPPVSGG